MDYSNEISTLNDLIQTCRDGENGFRTAAESIKDSHVKALFERFSRQRAEMVRELQEQVRALGGTPDQSGSVSASLHRGWMNIKSAVTGKDVAKAAYEKALKQELPAGARALVEAQAAIVRTAHDEVRALEKAHAR
jgi:uncharacterized protein (TIGR02284 family)